MHKMSRSSSKRSATSVVAGVEDGIMMILSPAKSLDLSPYEGRLETTLPDCDPAKTIEIARAMKARNETALGKLLSISSKLASTANGYWESYQEGDGGEERKPCIYAFTGMAYQGLQVQTCSDDAVLYLQSNLRIIDPLYGALRPLDKIQAYRLEMRTKGVLLADQKTKLADFWSDACTTRIMEDLQPRQSKILLNLASDEYSAALDTSALSEDVRYVKIIFHDGGRVVTVHAKRARGMMTRFVADSRCQSLEDVKAFDVDGYSFAAALSDESTLVFQRPKVEPGKRKAATTKKVADKRSKR